MKRIPTLDGWRAVAILVVLCHHIAAFNGNESWWLQHGRMGVDVFFAISGLLITSQLLQNNNLRTFYIRRVFRILPPAILYLVVVFTLHLIDSRDLAHCLLIERNFVAGSEYTGHFWSLSLEEQFYLLWPIVLLWSGKRAPTVAFAGIVAVCIWRAFGLSHGLGGYARTDMRCDGLLWGCLTAFALRSGNLKLGRIIPIICLCASICFWANPIFMPLTPLLLALMVLGTIQEPTWAVSRLLDSKPLVWIGQRSYGIYLWQILIIFAPVNVPMALKVGLVFIWCSFLYWVFESPLRRIGRKLASYSTRRKQYDAVQVNSF